MQTTRPIHLDDLADAPKRRVRQFERRFGRRVDVTVDVADQHYLFPWHWLAELLLGDAEWDRYCEAREAAREEFRQVYRPAEALLERAWAEAEQLFGRAKGRAWGRLSREERERLRDLREEPPEVAEAREELCRACDELRARYAAVHDPAYEKFRRRTARAFAECYGGAA